MTNLQPYLDRLTQQYLDLIYSSALRRLHGDTHRAADVTQAVLLVLLRKAKEGKLPREKHMAGWLIKITGYAVMQQTRSAARRARHESAAAYTNAQINPNESSIRKLDDDVRKALDDSLLKLGAIDREVVIRRHLQGQTLAQIGAAIGMQENTVGTRISRAMEKLRKILSHRGITAPVAAVSTILIAESAIKAPAAFALTSVPPSIAEAAKKLSWKLTMLKVKIAAVISLAITVLAGAGAAWVIGQSKASPATASTKADALVWPSNPPTIPGIMRVFAGPNDQILKELLTGLKLNQAKLHVIHVHSTDATRWYIAQDKTWSDSMFAQGEAWLEAGPNRRFRAEVSHARASAILQSGNLGTPHDSSFVETWDGKTTMREYRPPYSVPGSETFDKRYLQGMTLAGADFSMQLPWDEETASDEKGYARKTIDRNPLDPAVLTQMNLSARRVELNGQVAMQLDVAIPDPQTPQVHRTETFWFDPQRGYALLARRNILKLGNAEIRRMTYVIDSLIEAAPGIYYPGKAQMLWEQQGNPLLWENFVATQATANETTDASTFQLTFTSGIEIYDFNNGRGTKRKPTTQ